MPVTMQSRRIAKNSQWGAVCWGSGGEAPSRGMLRVWGQSPQPAEARGSRGGAPSAQKFCVFLQKLLHFRAILIEK